MHLASLGFMIPVLTIVAALLGITRMVWRASARLTRINTQGDAVNERRARQRTATEQEEYDDRAERATKFASMGRACVMGAVALVGVQAATLTYMFTGPSLTAYATVAAVAMGLAMVWLHVRHLPGPDEGPR